MSPHQNNCKANSCSCCRQNGCRKIPRASPVGAPHTNSANLRSARLKKGWRLCQPAPASQASAKKTGVLGATISPWGPCGGIFQGNERLPCVRSVDPASAFHDLIRVDFLAISSLWSHGGGRGGPVNSNLHQRESGKEG